VQTLFDLIQTIKGLAIAICDSTVQLIQAAEAFVAILQARQPVINTNDTIQDFLLRHAQCCEHLHQRFGKVRSLDIDGC
jgi:hypothetical protein